MVAGPVMENIVFEPPVFNGVASTIGKLLHRESSSLNAEPMAY